jgi:predicted RecA/RadA family phage recombinase
MKNFIQPGKNLTVAAPTGGVTSGDPVLIGALFGVAAFTAAETAEVELVTEGVFTLPKTTGEAWSVGDVLYWDATGKKLTTTVGSNKRVGFATAAAATADTTGNVRIGAPGAI